MINQVSPLFNMSNFSLGSYTLFRLFAWRSLITTMKWAHLLQSLMYAHAHTRKHWNKSVIIQHCTQLWPKVRRVVWLMFSEIRNSDPFQILRSQLPLLLLCPYNIFFFRDQIWCVCSYTTATSQHYFSVNDVMVLCMYPKFLIITQCYVFDTVLRVWQCHVNI